MIDVDILSLISDSTDHREDTCYMRTVQGRRKSLLSPRGLAASCRCGNTYGSTVIVFSGSEDIWKGYAYSRER